MASNSDSISENSTPMASDNNNADMNPVWNVPSTSSAEVRPVMGAESWPSLSLSARSSSNRSPSSESEGSPPSMPPPQAAAGAVTPLSSISNANTESSAAAMSPNDQRRRNNTNNNTSSSSSANRNHNNNSSSFPHHHGNRHGNQSGYNHRNYNGRGMNLQRGMGMMRPQMLMGPPSFPASSVQYTTQLGSYGGPIFYHEYAPHMYMPQQPPQSMAFVGHFPPMPVYFPSFDVMLYNRILTQVEYYFSADNLSRDTHLKNQMDHEGWVPIRVIAEFRRLAEMTNNIQTIVEAVRSSQVVEIKGETIRRRGDWNKYVWPRQPLSSRTTQ